MKDVTFRFWRPDEKMPEGSCRVLTMNKFGLIIDTNYSSKYRRFNALDSFSPEEVRRISWGTDKLVGWAEYDQIIEL